MSYRKTLFQIGLCLSSASITFAQTFAGVWSSGHACPVSCGTGQTYRDCLVNGQQADYSNCEGSSFIACDTGITCPSFPGVWSSGHACPVSCGTGQTYRDCLVNGQQADYANCEGSSFIECDTGVECPSSSTGQSESSSSSTGKESSSSSSTGVSFAGVWSSGHACPVSCGTGQTYRDCLVNGQQADYSNCEGSSFIECDTGVECPSSSSTGSESSSSSTGEESSSSTGEESSSSTGEESSSSSSSTGVSFPGVWSSGHACPVSCGTGQTYRDCLVNGQQADYSNCEGSSFIECDTGIVCPSSSSTGQSESSSSSSTGDDESSSTGVSFAGVWSSGHACPVSCGTGQTYRDCLVNGQQADYSNCEGSSFIACDTGITCPSFPGVWSSGHACPVSCGAGQTYRDCLVNGQQADYSNCEGSSTIACSVSTPCP